MFTITANSKNGIQIINLSKNVNFLVLHYVVGVKYKQIVDWIRLSAIWVVSPAGKLINILIHQLQFINPKRVQLKQA